MTGHPTEAARALAPAAPRNPLTRAHSREFWIPFAFLAIHAPLAVAMKLNPMVSTVHCLATIAAGLIIVLLRGGSERVAYVAAYVVGAEVLWRMTKAAAAWETGKYAVILLLFLGILRSGRWRIPVIPLVYIALMIPSTIAVVLDQGFAASRNAILMYWSGPLSLAVCAWFFSRVSLSRNELYTTSMALLGPIVGVGAVAFRGIASAQKIAFGDESSFQTSGGFGPNQVSSALGLGAMVLVLLLLSQERDRRIRALFTAIALWLTAQSALTFSRGGLYDMVAGLMLATLFIIRDPRMRSRLLLGGAIVCALGVFAVYPALNGFTGGKLEERFQSTDTTGRGDIMEGDLDLWRGHFVFGVGPGQSASMRVTHKGYASHTELTRMLAEHGVLGLASLLLLFGLAFITVLRAPTPAAKAWSAAFFGWSLLYMLNAAMRTAAPGFVYGLACARLCVPDRPHSRSVNSTAAP